MADIKLCKGQRGKGRTGKRNIHRKGKSASRATSRTVTRTSGYRLCQDHGLYSRYCGGS